MTEIELVAAVITAAKAIASKIRAEEMNDTPLHPLGHPDALWVTSDSGYPVEYDRLLDALFELDPEWYDENLAANHLT